MSKSIEFTQSQIQAKQNGATMFIFPVENYKALELLNSKSLHPDNAKEYFPLKTGDRDIEANEILDIDYTKDNSCLTFKRYTIKEVIDIRVVRVKDLRACDIGNMYHPLKSFMKVPDGSIFKDFKEYYNTQLKELNINRTYEDNDYIFLMKIKG